MTNIPRTPGPASGPNRPQQPAGAFAPRDGNTVPLAGSASPPNGSASPSFQYRPHDPYAHAAPGQEVGPFLPPPPTLGQRLGFLGKDDRPRQITVILQTLWIHLAVVLLVALIGIPVAASGSSAFGVVIVVFGFLAAAANLVLIWAVAKERLGRLGFRKPRPPIHIGLGLFGLNALIGFFSVWTFVPAVAEVAAALLVLVLFFTRPARDWLRDREGNQPKQAPEQRPLPGEDYLAARPGAPGPSAPPVPPGAPQQGAWPAAQAPPHAPGGHSAAPQGWPQPPR